MAFAVSVVVPRNASLCCCTLLFVFTSLLTKTPSLTYQQRKTAGHVVARVNDGLLPAKWAGLKRGVQVKHYNETTALTTPYQHMFQKVSEKALVLLERIEKMSMAICDHHNLPSPLSVSQPSLEPAIFTGQVVCEGEGQLNAKSCLLQGPSHSRWNKGARVQMEIPDNVTCSLFPGQVIAVEGINNYNGKMVASRILDEGVVPPMPIRKPGPMQSFTMLCAAGPFTTTDSLSYQPLHDLLAVVREEKPDLLVLLGPFIDDTHPLIKSCDIPGDVTFDAFFLKSILEPICLSVKSSKTRLVLIPSQRDAHHPQVVYPQPPFKFHHQLGFLSDSCFPDPCTLDVNGLVLGVSSTDILFHLSARTMFKGPVGDRMARLASHILQQQCYYPLLPAYQREEFGVKTTPTQPAPESSSSILETSSEVNLDLIHMFEDKYATLPTRPDLLLLSSNLKPFAKVIDGCMVINPGRLAKRNSGGTFMKLMVKDYSDIGVEVVNI